MPFVLKRIYNDEAIEEMASAVREITTACGKCEYYKDGSCLKPIDLGCNDNEDILNVCDALNEKGYCKANDLAREIFEEIEDFMIDSNIYKMQAKSMLSSKFAELKKKYTEAHNG